MLPQREELLLERQLFVGVIIRIDAAFLSHLLGDGHSLLPHWSTFFTSPGSPETPAASTLVGETSEICWLPRKASDVAINSAADTRNQFDPVRNLSIQKLPSELQKPNSYSDFKYDRTPIVPGDRKELQVSAHGTKALLPARGVLYESGRPKC